MKRISIFFWITFIFLLAFLGIGASYALALKYLKTSSQIQIQKRYDFISQTLIWQLANVRNFKELTKDLQRIDLVPITYPKEALQIVKSAEVLRRKIHPLGEAVLLKKDKEYYIWIRSLGNGLLLKDVSQNNHYNKILYTVIFAAMILLLFLIFILILFKLRPLKKITKEIEKFSQGNLDLDLDIKSSKEINEVAQALKNAVESLKAIQNSRKLLLRNIMHELKTPITKGRITAEMVEDKRQKERLIQIFEKLNSLINEFAALEAVNSKIKPNLEPLKASDILQEAINIGMFDQNDIKIVKEADPTIQADYRLMAIAFKNLIDNALKYAHDLPITIKIEEKSISFLNVGEPLKKDLSYYTEPFTKEHPKSGFGLGLYLVSNILKLHGFKLHYTYQNRHSSFTVIF